MKLRVSPTFINDWLYLMVKCQFTIGDDPQIARRWHRLQIQTISTELNTRRQDSIKGRRLAFYNVQEFAINVASLQLGQQVKLRSTEARVCFTSSGYMRKQDCLITAGRSFLYNMKRIAPMWLPWVVLKRTKIYERWKLIITLYRRGDTTGKVEEKAY